MKCFPYSYGDEGGSFSLSNVNIKQLVIVSVVSAPLILLPMVASAVDKEVVLRRIEQAIKELDGTKPYTRGICISAMGGVSCIVSGICLSQAKLALTQGNVGNSTSFVCGAAIALCGDRIAPYHGF